MFAAITSEFGQSITIAAYPGYSGSKLSCPLQTDIGDMMDFPLKPGDILNGYEVLISAVSIDGSQIGTFLGFHRNRNEFITADITGELLMWSEWTIPNFFRSYVHALQEFTKRVDEEAFKHESGEL